MSVSRAALYRSLGLVDAPLPERTCGGCAACTGRTPAAPEYYAVGKTQNKDRLEAIEAERSERMANVRLRAERSRTSKPSTPTLAWTREATS